MSFADPRATAHIPVTAGTQPFTPPVLDPWGAFQRDLPLLEAAVQSARASIAFTVFNPISDDEQSLASHKAEQEKLEAQRRAASVALDQRRTAARAEADRIGKPPVFLIKIPTATERDMLNSRLVQQGLTTVSDETMRSSMIEAIYEIDWRQEVDGVSDLASYQDDLAAFLDGYWQRETAQIEAQQRWHAQEVERLLDIASGAPPIDPEEMPARSISVREAHKARLLGDRLVETPRLRKLIAKKLDFSRRNAQLLVQMHLVKVTGIDGLQIVRDVRDDVLDEQSAIDVRETLERLYGKKTGEEAWIQLVAHIDRLYSLDEFEMGNSVSPLANPSDRSGSIAASGAPVLSAGSSTISSTELAPGAVSATIIAPSSGSGSAVTISSTSPGPTDAGSQPSPSAS